MSRFVVVLVCTCFLLLCGSLPVLYVLASGEITAQEQADNLLRVTPGR
jgi:hypothetical protein